VVNEEWGWSVSDLGKGQLRRVGSVGMGRYGWRSTLRRELPPNLGSRQLVFGELLLILDWDPDIAFSGAWILSGSDKMLFVMDPREVIDWTEPVFTGGPECSDAPETRYE